MNPSPNGPAAGRIYYLRERLPDPGERVVAVRPLAPGTRSWVVCTWRGTEIVCDGQALSQEPPDELYRRMLGAQAH